jgi:hypothetical protein
MIILTNDNLLTALVFIVLVSASINLALDYVSNTLNSGHKDWSET